MQELEELGNAIDATPRTLLIDSVYDSAESPFTQGLIIDALRAIHKSPEQIAEFMQRRPEMTREEFHAAFGNACLV